MPVAPVLGWAGPALLKQRPRSSACATGEVLCLSHSSSSGRCPGGPVPSLPARPDLTPVTGHEPAADTPVPGHSGHVPPVPTASLVPGLPLGLNPLLPREEGHGNAAEMPRHPHPLSGVLPGAAGWRSLTERGLPQGCPVPIPPHQPVTTHRKGQLLPPSFLDVLLTLGLSPWESAFLRRARVVGKQTWAPGASVPPGEELGAQVL